MGRKANKEVEPRTSTVRISETYRIRVASESAKLKITSAQFVDDALGVYLQGIMLGLSPDDMTEGLSLAKKAKQAQGGKK